MVCHHGNNMQSVMMTLQSGIPLSPSACKPTVLISLISCEIQDIYVNDGGFIKIGVKINIVLKKERINPVGQG